VGEPCLVVLCVACRCAVPLQRSRNTTAAAAATPSPTKNQRNNSSGGQALGWLTWQTSARQAAMGWIVTKEPELTAPKLLRLDVARRARRIWAPSRGKKARGRRGGAPQHLHGFPGQGGEGDGKGAKQASWHTRACVHPTSLSSPGVCFGAPVRFPCSGRTGKPTAATCVPRMLSSMILPGCRYITLFLRLSGVVPLGVWDGPSWCLWCVAWWVFVGCIEEKSWLEL